MRTIFKDDVSAIGKKRQRCILNFAGVLWSNAPQWPMFLYWIVGILMGRRDGVIPISFAVAAYNKYIATLK